MQVGDILKRKRKKNDRRDSVRLVGVRGGRWIAESLDDFGAPFELDAATLASEFGEEPGAPGFDEQAALREADIRTNAEDATAYFGRGRRTAGEFVPDPASPEGQFRALAEAEGDDAQPG